MSQPPDFRDVFDSVALAADLAAKVESKDYRERAVSGVEVVQRSARGEVQVVVEDAQITSLRLSDFWFAGAEQEEVEHLVQATVNDAWSRWNAESMEQLQNVTPEMSAITSAVSQARKDMHEAYSAALDEIRSR